MQLPDKAVVSVRGRTIGAVLVLAGLLSGCGGDEGNGDGPTPAPTEATTTQSPTPGAQPVGRVISVLESLARIEGERAGGGDPLFQGSVVSTDVRGRATFSVLDILEDCQIQSDSRLRIAPSPKNPLDVDQGSIICRSKPGEEEFQVEAGEAVVGFLDPIFQLEVGRAKTDVRVDFGFVQVKKGTGRSAGRLVGPGSEFTVGAESLRERATRFQMDSLDRFDVEALRRMRAALPREVRGFPSTANSRTLPAARSQRALRVGFDEIVSDETEGFIEGVFDVIADRWGVGADANSVDRTEASEALAAGRLDAFVSAEPVPGAAQIPLFGDERERTWFLRVRPDAGFQSALEVVLKSILNSGEYAAAYSGAYGELPTYEAVRSLVYPSSRQVNRSQWRQPEEVRESPSAEAEVSQLTLAATPAKFSGICPTKVTFAGKVVVEQPGIVEYQYLRQDGTVSKLQSADFAKSGTYELDRQTLDVGKSGSGWWILVVPDQGVQSEKATYTVTCASPPVID
jgi:hypothetical protein